MAYFLSTDLPDGDSHLFDKRQKEQWKAYKHHLGVIQQKLRPATRDFALAEWHYNTEDHRCPHDAWLENLSLSEIAPAEDMQSRSLLISVRLLGAYHDGHIALSYEGVLSYALDYPMIDLRAEKNRGHGDWMVDEISFSDRGKVLHEIEWRAGVRWTIECDDIRYEWLPFA